MQRGMDDSERGVIISLLVTMRFIFMKINWLCIKNKESAATVSSLREKVMMESLTSFIDNIVRSDDPKAIFDTYSAKISELFQLKCSIKHMRGIDMEKFALISSELFKKNLMGPL
ncbi:hypothetical protein [Candidatus Sarmatiella mevalonica]|uniref:hypothetical protein n=1 Tax=Candidatus Sarmatiella mevalonica TaxID=2770581 RepID=UPI001921450B|nr:hypothetical protein [Candidatus Sarmatiella mevalonica]